MTRYTLIGIDPGAITTGAVCLELDSSALTLWCQAEALPGNNSAAVRDWVESLSPKGDRVLVFGERYRNRGTHTNQKMSKLEGEIRALVPTIKWIDNTGFKKVITQELMELFKVWNFSTPSHHQDLRAAARIALYGAVKDDELNSVLYSIAQEKLNPRPRPTAADYRAYYGDHPEELGEHDPTL